MRFARSSGLGRNGAVVRLGVHVERLVLEKFIAAVGSADESLKLTLKPLCDLFALSRIEADRGWFLEAGYVSANKSKAVRSLVTKLCGEVRLIAVPLVDAFGIPDEVLAAPIAVER